MKKSFLGKVHNCHKCSYCRFEYNLSRNLAYFGSTPTRQQASRKNVRHGLTPKQLERRKQVLLVGVQWRNKQ